MTASCRGRQNTAKQEQWSQTNKCLLPIFPLHFGFVILIASPHPFAASCAHLRSLLQMTVHFSYLDIEPLAGRGGVVRFFMLNHGIDFEEHLHSMGDGAWEIEKQRMIQRCSVRAQGMCTGGLCWHRALKCGSLSKLRPHQRVCRKVLGV